MRQSATEKQCWLGNSHVHRVSDLAMQEKGLAHMVQQHEQNDQPAQGIDGMQPCLQGLAHAQNSFCRAL
jgi:hypothetical protein